MPLHEIAAGDERLLQEVADLLSRSHKILVITGAGISTSCGIPDFRSKDGLYNLIPQQTFPLTPPSSEPSTPSRKRKVYTTDDDASPPSSQSSNSSSNSRQSSGINSKLRGQDLFDSSLWKNPASIATFYQFIASLRQKIYEEVKDTSLTHKFIRTLRDSGRLMRCYTQNIDGLEMRDGLCMDLSRGKGNKRRFMKKHFEAPLPEQTLNTDFDGGCEVVPLHGDLDKLRCTMCQQTYDWSEEATEDFLEGRAPECEKCTSKSDQRQANGKRGLAVGSLRPNIVLYGEEHPSNTLLSPLVPFDIASGPEVLIIMGTSLKVFGLQKVVRDFAKAVHSMKDGKGRVIFVNRTKPAESIWEGIIDDFVGMDCDDWVTDLNERRPDLSLRQIAIDRKVTKPTVKRKRSSADDEQQKPPQRKVKISVEFPKAPKKTSKKVKPANIQTLCPEEQQLSPSLILSLAVTQTHATPRPISRSWKKNRSDHPNQQILSPLVQSLRPKPSPLYKALVRSEMHDEPANLQRSPRKEKQSGTPTRLPFSPITPSSANDNGPLRPQFSPTTPNTPTRRMLKIFGEVTDSRRREEDGNTHPGVRESDHENEKENGIAVANAEKELTVSGVGTDCGVVSQTSSRRASGFKDGPVQTLDQREPGASIPVSGLRPTGTALYMRLFADGLKSIIS